MIQPRKLQWKGTPSADSPNQDARWGQNQALKEWFSTLATQRNTWDPLASTAAQIPIHWSDVGLRRLYFFKKGIPGDSNEQPIETHCGRRRQTVSSPTPLVAAKSRQ